MNFSENKKQLILTIMKTKIGILVLALSTSFINVQAQRTVTTTRASSYDISDNLDLDAVASIFGDSEDLEDFEHRLNDPDNRISNLDLNEDGYIDYLRVLENSSDRNSLVVIQAVLDEDVFQDVATIEIEKTHNGNPRIQIVGDAYIYGSDYIVEPVFVSTPLIFSFFWGPRYASYHSPYYWNYYPSWYSYYRPYSPYRYQRHVDVYVNRYNTYRHTTTRNFQYQDDNYNRIRRNDFATRYPDRAFEHRNEGVRNRYELNERRPNNQVSRQRNIDPQRSNNRQYQESKSSNRGINERQRSMNENSRPVYREKSGQTAPREYNRNSDRSRIDNNNGQVQRKIEPRNGSFDNRTAPERRNESTPARPAVSNPDRPAVSSPDRSSNRVERSSAPREKSATVSDRNRSNSEVRQASPSVRKSDAPRENNQKENGNRRRRE
jgi:hypothetical protein